MPTLADLRTRRRRPEIMDGPDLAPDAHRDALAGLGRINAWSAASSGPWPIVKELARRAGRPPLRVLDLATGGGDVPLSLWGRANRAGLKIVVSGCDKSPLAVDSANERARKLGAEAAFFVRDVVAEGPPEGADVLTCSLFLHHLDAPEAVGLLAGMREKAQEAAVVCDLERGPIGYALAWLGTRLLSGSRVVHEDGPISVEGAFTQKEALELARQAGWERPQSRRTWPCRFVMSWSRPHEDRS